MKHSDAPARRPAQKWGRAAILVLLVGIPVAFVAGALAPEGDSALFYQPVFFATAVGSLLALAMHDVLTLRSVVEGSDEPRSVGEQRTVAVVLSLRITMMVLLALAALWEGGPAFVRFFEHVT